ncbi:MAG TPA: sialate O-acetylesterase [Isosphaeraceae bacterium]
MRRDRALLIPFVLLGLAPLEAHAEIKLPAIFGPHMVFQRHQKDKVWGTAEPGERVVVAIAGQEKATEAGPEGKWSVTLDPMPAGGPHSLTVSGKKDTVVFDDVLVGEVWICSGQSNMEWQVSNANDGDLESLAARYPKIRLISVPKVGTQEPQSDFKGKWEACTPETVKGFSAVGYFFGRQIHQTIGVPVGLIDDSWGGSAAEAWVSRDRLAADPKFKGLLAEWDKFEKDVPRLQEEFERRAAERSEAEAKAKAEGKTTPTRLPGGIRAQPPKARLSGNQRPANIYNGVLKPTIGYGIKGVIWYQGESNVGRGNQYRDLFPLMIQSWRDEWGIGDFPFYWVQLADFLQEKPEPGESGWAELREAQTMTMDRLKNTGQAVIVDLGEAQDIHPRNKHDVALRLSRWALARDYGVHVPYKSPSYKSMTKQGDSVVLTFDNAENGLKAFDVPEVRGFTVANGDHKFVKATAKIVGKDKVEVRADGVADPVAVRYAWADNPVCNLYSSAGLPVTPFRTDDWPGVTGEH